jgi:hypothetical protein
MEEWKQLNHRDDDEQASRVAAAVVKGLAVDGEADGTMVEGSPRPTKTASHYAIHFFTVLFSRCAVVCQRDQSTSMLASKIIVGECVL